MMEWLTIVVSIALPVIVGVSGWFFQRVISRTDSIQLEVAQMIQKKVQLEARLSALEKTSLTRDDLRDVVEQALMRAVAPITTELKAISANGQETRERLVRLEATYHARDGG